jgi:hypothetical protein
VVPVEFVEVVWFSVPDVFHPFHSALTNLKLVETDPAQ